MTKTDYPITHKLLIDYVALTETMKNDAIKKFGFDPETVGLRHRSWYIAPDDEEGKCYTDSFDVNWIPAGCLVVEARDGALNPEDEAAYKKPNFEASWENEFDSTYRYYAFTPLESEE